MSTSATFEAAQNAPMPANVPRTAQAALRILRRLQHGELVLQLPGGQVMRFGHGLPHAKVLLTNWNVFSATLRNGDIGFAESYLDGDWTTDNLGATLDLLVANRDVLERVIYGSWIGRQAHRLRHYFNRNSKRGSRRNIHAHYDLGNNFYASWLDQSMTYSSALFSANARSLEQAQMAKYQRILNQTGCSAGDSMLEIGCGWGGFAEVAARAGHSLRGISLSAEQLAWAQQRLEQTALSGKTKLLLQDYRDETGQFDAIVSIEMFEAVGKQYWPGYFETIARCLKPGGRAVIQTITIADALFDRYERGSDFIQQYIFPGGMLPSPERFTVAAERAGLRVTDRFAFGRDYARTLSIWHEQFEAQAAYIGELGFDERFMRTWRFYLAYCEAAFNSENTDVYQFTLEHDVK